MDWTSLRRRLGDDRLGLDWHGDTWARKEAHRLQRRFLRQAWWRTLVLAGILALGLTPMFLVLGAEGRWFLAGSFVASLPWLLAYITVLWSGSASLWAGEGAEVLTAAELMPLRRRGWKAMSNPTFGLTGDVDHVAIGPGGIVVLETKWRNRIPKRLDTEAVARQIERNRKDVVGIARRAVNDPPVLGCIVWWGPYEFDPPTPLANGIQVLHGRDLKAWLSSLPGDRMTPTSIAAVFAELVRDAGRRKDFLRARDQSE